ncbi:MAG: RICIN domain-containing protein [Polyangiaceae bacterium]
MRHSLASQPSRSLLVLLCLAGCAPSQGTNGGQTGGVSGGGATTGSGGTTTSPEGGTSSGGTSSGGTPAGGSATGGTSSGGSVASTGGTSSGGSTTGGASAGGSSQGGSSQGGSSQGGSSQGGSSQGGSSQGGSAKGGASGGTAAGGGTPVGGGGAMGGSAMGGTTSGGTATGGSGMGGATASWPLVNGIQWADTAGNPIQAHGAGALLVDGYYYLFGENRNPDGSFFAVSAYRSRDLMHWEFVNHVLRESSAAELDPANIERPKVVYNASTKQFVMWMHWENGVNYGEARAAVATSSSVTGAYTYRGSLRPLAGSGVTDHDKPGYMSRDCTLFVDDDGKGYFISASNENYDLNIYELAPDYLSIARLAAAPFKGGHREAPALFKRNGVYFLLTSGATGWSPNQAQYATSKSITSGWSALSNVGDGTTFYSQSTFVLPVQGSAGTAYLYLGDRWAGAWSGPVNDSSYVWEPITFPSSTTMSMSWSNTLSIDVSAGAITGTTRNFRFINVKSNQALDVAGASTANSAAIVQNPEGNANSQVWSLNYNAAGYFRLTNAQSRRILEVPNESTADGVALTQYDDHNGDNQAWRIIDIGNGRFKLRNKKSGKFVGVVQASNANAAPIEQRASGSGEEQQWKLVAAP